MVFYPKIFILQKQSRATCCNLKFMATLQKPAPEQPLPDTCVAAVLHTWGTKLYNKLSNYIKNIENPKPFKNQLKAFLLQQTFYSVEEYLTYNQVKNSLYK
jgi:hypothetical protein